MLLREVVCELEAVEEEVLFLEVEDEAEDDESAERTSPPRVEPDEVLPLRDEEDDCDEVLALRDVEVVVVVEAAANWRTSVAFLTLRVVPLLSCREAVREVNDCCGLAV